MRLGFHAPIGPVVLVVRPHQLIMRPPIYKEGKESVTWVSAIVEQASYLGDKIDYRVRTEGNVILRVVTMIDLSFNKGENVSIGIPSDKCIAITKTR